MSNSADEIRRAPRAGLTRGRILLAGTGLTVAIALVLTLIAVVGGDDYWDGGAHGGEPVVDFAGRLTEDAHDELEECGYSDEEAGEVATTGGVTERFEVSESGGVESSGTIESTVLEPRLYEVRCTRVP